MLYEDLMMDTSMKIRYNMFRLLSTLDESHYSIYDLAQKLHLTYQQAYHHINELNREIQFISDQQESILIKNSGIRTNKLNLSLDEYRYHLLQISTPFRFIQYTLNHKTPSLDEFCDEMFISRSTLSRKIKPLTEFLKRFHVRISYTNMSLVGDERKVRLMLFYIMWLGTRGIVWPFTFEEEKINVFKEKFNCFSSLSQTFVGQKELSIMYSICYARIQRHFYVPYDKKYDFFTQNHSLYDLTLLDQHFALTAKQAKGETAFLYFFSLFAPYFSTVEDPTLTLTLQAFSFQPNIVADFVSDFLEECNLQLKDQPLTLEETKVLRANLLHILFAFYCFEGAYPHLNAFVTESHKDTPPSPKFSYYWDKFLMTQVRKEKYTRFRSSLNEITQAFYALSSPYLNARKEKKPLTVILALEHNQLFMQQLLRFLDHLTFVEVKDYNTKCKESQKNMDLIISSSFALKKEYPTVDFYYWDLDFNYEQLIYLYKLLQQLYMKKNGEF